MLKNIIYELLSFILPNTLQNKFGSSKKLRSLRNWLFDRSKVIKPFRRIRWNGYSFYFHAPLQILTRANYRGIESSLTKAILSIISENSNVIDIGSNYGFITIVSSIYIKNGGIVYSFECEDSIIRNLECSIRKNKLKNIKLFNVTLGDKNDEKTKTVDSLIFEECDKIDLIKIDTDGTDLECLKGCSEILDKFHPVIVIEINNNLGSIIKYTRLKGYNYFYNQFFSIVDSESKIDYIPNLICSKKSLTKPILKY